MTDDEMRQLIDDTLDTQLEANRFSVNGAQRAIPGAPVSGSDLRALEANIKKRGFALPPSYRQFLSIYDGIEGYRMLESFGLRSAAQVVAEEDDDEEWEDFEPACRFIIGTGYATVIAGFDPDSADDAGEMKVIEFSSDGDPLEHENFEAFLRFNLDLHQGILAREKADRANLADD